MERGSIKRYVFMAWDLVKHNDFTLTLPYQWCFLNLFSTGVLQKAGV